MIESKQQLEKEYKKRFEQIKNMFFTGVRIFRAVNGDYTALLPQDINSVLSDPKQFTQLIQTCDKIASFVQDNTSSSSEISVRSRSSNNRNVPKTRREISMNLNLSQLDETDNTYENNSLYTDNELPNMAQLPLSSLDEMVKTYENNSSYTDNELRNLTELALSPLDEMNDNNNYHTSYDEKSYDDDNELSL